VASITGAIGSSSLGLGEHHSRVAFKSNARTRAPPPMVVRRSTILQLGTVVIIGRKEPRRSNRFQDSRAAGKKVRPSGRIDTACLADGRASSRPEAGTHSIGRPPDFSARLPGMVRGDVDRDLLHDSAISLFAERIKPGSSVLKYGSDAGVTCTARDPREHINLISQNRRRWAAFLPPPTARSSRPLPIRHRAIAAIAPARTYPHIR